MIVRAPGRVNLIGGHADYTGGLVLPMAIDLATEISGERDGDTVSLVSDSEQSPAVVPLDVEDPAALTPAWARYVGGVVAEVGPRVGFTGTVSTTIPIGTGLSSSAALEVGVALAIGAEGSAVEIAKACQRAEHRASGVPCGIMDQLASLAGVEGHGVLIDCTSLDVTPVPLPVDDMEVVVVPSGQARSLAGSGYAERAEQTKAAAAALGPIGGATIADLDRIDDPVLRRRGRHVVTEYARVRATVDAYVGGDVVAAGALMTESHVSLRDDQEVTTDVLDALVERLCATPGVLGARLTGGGWGGCVVAITRPGALDEGWTVHPCAGAHVVD